MNKELLAKQAAEHYRQGEFVQAKKDLISLVEQGVESAALFNQLGIVSNKLEEYSEAEKYYQQALAIQPDHVDAMYNLALALYFQKKTSEAMAALLAVIKVSPVYLSAHFTLGKILLEKKMLEQANQHFDFIVNEQPENLDYLSQIVAVLLQHHAHELAKIYCEKFHRLDPDNIEVVYNLAVIAAKEECVDDAIAYYQRVLSKKPDHFPALNNLAVIYLELKNKAAAAHYFEEALKLQPSNESIQYSLSVIKGDQTAAPPKAYIKDLFNQYAEHYEIHLRKSLDYRVPELLKNTLKTNVGCQTPEWNILDLGCGTGLCGEVFADWSAQIVGVDLAEKMLDVAREKNCYQDLIASDVETYLASCSQSFDLILSADVFIYLGDLSVVFAEVFRCLNMSGFFAFSVELNDKYDYQTQESGRFAHSVNYIKALAKKNGFKVLAFESAKTRKQDKQPVNGGIIVLQK